MVTELDLDDCKYAQTILFFVLIFGRWVWCKQIMICSTFIWMIWMAIFVWMERWIAFCVQFIIMSLNGWWISFCRHFNSLLVEWLFLCEWIDGISKQPFHFSFPGFSFVYRKLHDKKGTYPISITVWLLHLTITIQKTMLAIFLFHFYKAKHETVIVHMDFQYTFPSPFNVTTRTKQKINTSISHLGHQH